MGLSHWAPHCQRGPACPVTGGNSLMFGHPRTALLLYAVAMGYLEAAVVVYLHAIY